MLISECLNSPRFWPLILVLLLGGCASPTTVHIYSKYFEDDELQPLIEVLKENKFEVETNKFDIPASVSENAILYSLMVDDIAKVEQVQSLSTSAGFKVNQQLPLTRANHWYTKNSLALILFPDNVAETGYVFQQDLNNIYQPVDCDSELILEFGSDGSYQIRSETADYQWNEEDKDLLSGTWLYRQFPYVELRTKTHNDKYVYFMYFEISKYSKRDQVSEIDMLKLTPVEEYQVFNGCNFEFGKRVSG